MGRTSYVRYAEFTLSPAFSFGLYGLTKKKVGASYEAMHSLAAETAVLSPIAVLVLSILVARGETTFLDHGTGHTLLPVLAGVVTAVLLLLLVWECSCSGSASAGGCWSPTARPARLGPGHRTGPPTS